MTSPAVTTSDAAEPRPTRPAGHGTRRWLVLVGILVPLVWGIIGLDVSLERIADAPGLIWQRFTSMVPPDWSGFSSTFDKMLESLYVAWIGTLIGATLSFPLAFLAATDLAPPWISTPTRAFLSGVRAFPELVLAIVLIPAFGLGPFTAVLAIGIHSIGTLGKLGSEVIEGIDRGPIEAITAAGGDRLAQVRFGIIPQAMPNILAHWLYRFEINVRASAVLGVIGAGGIGDELIGRIRFREWEKAGAVLLLTIVTVLLIDAASAGIRRRIVTGEPGRGPLGKWMVAIVGEPLAPDPGDGR